MRSDLSPLPCRGQGWACGYLRDVTLFIHSTLKNCMLSPLCYHTNFIPQITHFALKNEVFFSLWMVIVSTNTVRIAWKFNKIWGHINWTQCFQWIWTQYIGNFCIVHVFSILCIIRKLEMAAILHLGSKVVFVDRLKISMVIF